MRKISEREIKDISARGVRVIDRAGESVTPYKFDRPEKPASKEPQLVQYFKLLLESLREAHEDRKASRTVLERIAGILAEKLTAFSVKSNLRPHRYVFTVTRDNNGRIKEIEAIAKD